MTDVIVTFVAPTPNLLHHNNVGATYAKTSNFKMELIRFVPLYSVAMLQSIVTIIKAPFVSTLVHNVVGIESIPQAPRGIKLVSMHEQMPKKVNKFFASQPLDLGGGNLDPLRPLGPLGYFGLPMVNPSKPPLPPNRPYH